MKKIHALILLIILLQIGAGGCFLLWQNLHQYKMQHVQHSKNLVFLQVEKQDFALLHWEKKGKEFILEGKRYDVENITLEKGKYIIACVHDTKEEKIVRNLVSQYSDNQATTQKTTALKYPFFEYIFSIEKIETFIFTPKKERIITENISAYWFYDKPTSPPPQVN